MTIIETKLQVHTQERQNAEANSKIATNFTQSQQLRLPTINVPNFEGGYSKWPAFRDLFCGVFQNLSESQKLSHLHT